MFEGEFVRVVALDGGDVSVNGYGLDDVTFGNAFVQGASNGGEPGNVAADPEGQNPALLERPSCRGTQPNQSRNS